ncbi:MAG: NAD(P)-binding domain-containing protein [Galactobacter sp.]
MELEPELTVPITQPLTVAVLGGGTMATAVATLVARGGGRVRVWARNPTQAGWVVEDVVDGAPQSVGQVTAAASLREAVKAAQVVVPAVPWGPALAQVVNPVLDLLDGKVVVDVGNPYEMTALGPKLAMVVPGGSAAALLAEALPAGAAQLHCFTQVRADKLNRPVPGDEIVLPYVIDGEDAAPKVLKPFLDLVEATGWLPTRIGGLDQSALIEEGGPWAAARGEAGQGLLTRPEAMERGLLS